MPGKGSEPGLAQGRRGVVSKPRRIWLASPSSAQPSRRGFRSDGEGGTWRALAPALSQRAAELREEGVAGVPGAKGGWVSRLVGVMELRPRGRGGTSCRARLSRPPRPLAVFISIWSATPQQPLSRSRRRGFAGAGAPGSLSSLPSPLLPRLPPPPARPRPAPLSGPAARSEPAGRVIGGRRRRTGRPGLL